MASTLEYVPASTAQRIIRKFERDQTPYAVAAILIGEISPRDLDGVMWRFAVSDGHRIDTVDAGLSGTRGGTQGMRIDVAGLERVVEHMSGAFARESRLDDLVAASPLALDKLSR